MYAWGHEFPTVPITIIVPSAAGSGTYQNSRAMAQSMAEGFGTTVEKLAKLVSGAAMSKRMVLRQESLGSEAVTSTPNELVQYQASEVRTWGLIIRAAGIEPK